MLDIETVGAKSYSAILSIAAVEFDIETGETGREFNKKVDLQSCIDLGLQLDGETIYWWLKQDNEARKNVANGNKILIKEVLKQFSEFYRAKYIWGNSARFDCGLLVDAYNSAKIAPPFAFWSEMDVRTLSNLKPEIKKSTEFVGIRHNAIDDCKHQIKYCSAIWNELNL